MHCPTMTLSVLDRVFMNLCDFALCFYRALFPVELCIFMFDSWMLIIYSGSNYEVNISYTLRARFIDLMQDYDIWMKENTDKDDINIDIDAIKLLLLFNEVIMEMYQLLDLALSRFKVSLNDRQHDVIGSGTKQMSFA